MPLGLRESASTCSQHGADYLQVADIYMQSAPHIKLSVEIALACTRNEQLTAALLMSHE